jgi:hypothetical protein
MSVAPLTPEVQLVQVQADLATLQYVLAHLIVRLPPNDQELVVGMVEAAARSLDDSDRHLPAGPGTVDVGDVRRRRKPAALTGFSWLERCSRVERCPNGSASSTFGMKRGDAVMPACIVFVH